MASYELAGKTAFVTGAGSGIGEACVHSLARSGAQVVVADINADQATRVAADIVAKGGKAHPRTLDVTNEDAVNAAIGDIVAQFGRLDIAVNNAGSGAGPALTGDYPTADWRYVMSLNLDGVFYCLRAEIAAMRTSGGGSIINMASVVGEVAVTHMVAYVTSKHAVVGLTKAAALEHAPDHIRINAVGPGYTATPAVLGLDASIQKAWAADQALNRLAEPAEIAEMVSWLASDAASFATGTFYPIDGGYLAR